MTSLKQIEANRLNARQSTGPRTQEGKERSRRNALRHGLTAETVITAFENTSNYEAFEATIVSDYQPRTSTDRELVLRLASVLWRLRRSTAIETGLFQIQGELMRDQMAGTWRRQRTPLPQWYDELDVVAPAIDGSSIESSAPDSTSGECSGSPQMLAFCFLRVSRLAFGTFELFTRYETALWRQAAQLTIMLQSAARR